MPTDRFLKHSKTLESPIDNSEVVTKSDDTDLDNVSRALNCHESGIVRVTLKEMADDSSVDLYCVQGLNPYRVKRVWDTGTTNTGTIISCY